MAFSASQPISVHLVVGMPTFAQAPYIINPQDPYSMQMPGGWLFFNYFLFYFANEENDDEELKITVILAFCCGINIALYILLSK